MQLTFIFITEMEYHLASLLLQKEQGYQNNSIFKKILQDLNYADFCNEFKIHKESQGT